MAGGETSPAGGYFLHETNRANGLVRHKTRAD